VSYFDPAYIEKFYLDEPESEAVRRLAESLGQVRCVVIGQTEVAAVFHRKFREGAFVASAFRDVMALDHRSHAIMPSMCSRRAFETPSTAGPRVTPTTMD
jgi:hypothetical protein